MADGQPVSRPESVAFCYTICGMRFRARIGEFRCEKIVENPNSLRGNDLRRIVR